MECTWLEYITPTVKHINVYVQYANLNYLRNAFFRIQHLDESLCSLYTMIVN